MHGGVAWLTTAPVYSRSPSFKCGEVCHLPSGASADQQTEVALFTKIQYQFQLAQVVTFCGLYICTVTH